MAEPINGIVLRSEFVKKTGYLYGAALCQDLKLFHFKLLIYEEVYIFHFNAVKYLAIRLNPI